MTPEELKNAISETCFEIKQAQEIPELKTSLMDHLNELLSIQKMSAIVTKPETKQ